ncbi:hypothetical protein KCU86_g2828, partial [Aureobasidium melanogenum]
MGLILHPPIYVRLGITTSLTPATIALPTSGGWPSGLAPTLCWRYPLEGLRQLSGLTAAPDAVPGLLLQALQTAHDAAPPALPAPFPLIQSLIEARDYRPTYHSRHLLTTLRTQLKQPRSLIATQFSTATGMMFSCPVPNSKIVSTESYTIERFHKHMEDHDHFKHFYDTSSHRCLFGCEKGFLNEFALHRHAQQSMCEETAHLSEAIKNCSLCSSTSPDVIGALDHLEQRHGHVLANTNSLFPLYYLQHQLPNQGTFLGPHVTCQQPQ